MSWRRLPTFLPNFPLILKPLTQEQQALYESTGFLKTLTFKTVPSVNKVCCRMKSFDTSLCALGEYIFFLF